MASALSVAAKVTARVKRRRDGDMGQRWCTAGLLRAEESVRRGKGHQQMHFLLQALDRIHESLTNR